MERPAIKMVFLYTLESPYLHRDNYYIHDYLSSFPLYPSTTLTLMGRDELYFLTKLIRERVCLTDFPEVCCWALQGTRGAFLVRGNVEVWYLSWWVNLFSEQNFLLVVIVYLLYIRGERWLFRASKLYRELTTFIKLVSEDCWSSLEFLRTENEDVFTWFELKFDYNNTIYDLYVAPFLIISILY